jgi:hypothetical protein
MIGKPNIQVTRAVSKTWRSKIFRVIKRRKMKQQATALLLQIVERSSNKQSGTPKNKNKCELCDTFQSRDDN